MTTPRVDGRRSMMGAFSMAARVVLGLVALNNLVRGGFHVLASDGGVSRIPGLELGTKGPTIIALFTLVGLNQALIGSAEAMVLFWRRDLVPPVLCLQVALTAAAVANLHFGRSLPVAVPGEVFNQGLLPVVAAACLMSLIAARSEHQATASKSSRAP